MGGQTDKSFCYISLRELYNPYILILYITLTSYLYKTGSKNGILFCKFKIYYYLLMSCFSCYHEWYTVENKCSAFLSNLKHDQLS